jgi:hypothetical protein
MPNLVLVYLEMVLVSVQDRWTVCAKCRNSFGCTRPFSLVTRLKWKLISVRLGIVPILTQDRCTVWAKRTIGLENRFEHTRWNSSVTSLMRNLVSVHSGTVLVSEEDRCTVCAKHTIGSEIVLDAPNGTSMLRGSSGSSFHSIWR